MRRRVEVRSTTVGHGEHHVAAVAGHVQVETEGVEVQQPSPRRLCVASRYTHARGLDHAVATAGRGISAAPGGHLRRCAGAGRTLEAMRWRPADT